MPRYDVPKAAPEPLRQVQLLVNTVDLHNEVEWLPDWLATHALESEAGRAGELREAVRGLVLANNGVPLSETARAAFNRAARRVVFELDEAGELRLHPGADALDEIVAIVLRAILDGSWGRLKACRNCRWSFFDYSPNRSARWCSMLLCGNRTKTRAYRTRKRSRAVG